MTTKRMKVTSKKMIEKKIKAEKLTSYKMAAKTILKGIHEKLIQ